MKYTLLLFMCLEFREIDEGFGGYAYINTKGKRDKNQTLRLSRRVDQAL